MIFIRGLLQLTIALPLAVFPGEGDLIRGADLYQ